MKKKELLGKIEELEIELVSLKERITILEARTPAISYPIYPKPQETPTYPWDTWKSVPTYPPYIFYC